MQIQTQYVKSSIAENVIGYIFTGGRGKGEKTTKRMHTDMWNMWKESWTRSYNSYKVDLLEVKVNSSHYYEE